MHRLVITHAGQTKNHVFDIPEAWELMKRGMLWAADGKKEAVEKNLTVDEFKSERKMF